MHFGQSFLDKTHRFLVGIFEVYIAIIEAIFKYISKSLLGIDLQFKSKIYASLKPSFRYQK